MDANAFYNEDKGVNYAEARYLCYYLQEQGVLVSDAGTDDRFRRGESIAKHQIREVICVPMKGRRHLSTPRGSQEA